MTATPVWIAAWGGPPPAAVGASPMYFSSDPAATPIQIMGYGGPGAGGTPIWIARPNDPGATAATIAAWGAGGAAGGAPSAPTNVTSPTISGTPQVGQTLTASNGTWNGSPTSYSYQWLDNVSGYIAGATSQTYTVRSADVGNLLYVIVTAANAAGSLGVESNGVGPVTATSTWSAADAAANSFTLSNGGLTVTPSGASSWLSLRSSISKTSGKLYIEFANGVAATSVSEVFGLASSGFNVGNYLGSGPYSVGFSLNGAGTVVSAGFTANVSPPILTPALNDVFALAVDFVAGNIWFGQNNVWIGGGNPATGASPSASFVPATVGALFAGASFNGGGVGVWTLQPTPASQKYLPPAGFQAWDGGPVTPASSTWSAVDASATGMTLSNGGMTVNDTAAGWGTVRNTISHSSGKYYVEFLCTANVSGQNTIFGVANSGFTATSYIGSSNYSGGLQTGYGSEVSSGFTTNYAFTSPIPVATDVWAMAVDFATGNMWFAKNNAWINASNPGTGSLPFITFVPATVGALFVALSENGVSGGAWTLQPTAASQKYAPPSGFSAWG